MSARELLLRHSALLINLFLFGTLGYWAAARAYQAWHAEKLNLVEAAFFTHNVVLLAVILLRREHIALDRSFWHQLVALIAFFSGIGFDETPAAASAAMLYISEGVTLLAIVLGIVTLINLGRSFGILIALRKVRTGGLYAFVRHPMYATDILWRVGFILQNACTLNLGMMFVSTTAYVYRALLEEKFLRQFPDYQAYMQRVRYRFIPGLF